MNICLYVYVVRKDILIVWVLVVMHLPKIKKLPMKSETKDYLQCLKIVW